jgi:hypothetical protein
VKPRPVGLFVGLGLGVPVMLVGIVGLATHTDATPPSSYLKFFVGGDLVHDFLIAPVAGAIAFVLLRRAPSGARAPVRFALFTSAVVVAIAWPALRGYGRMRAPDNKSVQPLNYATAVGTVIATIFVVSVLWLVAHATAQARRRVSARGRNARD